MPDETTKQGVPTRTFTDATTDRTFEVGKPHDFTPGEYANFERAGLIVDPADEQPAPTS